MSDFSYKLSGHVRHQGLPLAKVLVRVSDLFDDSLDGSGAQSFEMQSGTKGEYCFNVRAGIYRVEVVPQPQSRFLGQMIQEVRVNSNTIVDCNVSTGYIIAGTLSFFDRKVVNGDVDSLSVVALGIEPVAYRGEAKVDAEGQFSLVVPRGKYHIAVSQNEKTGADIAGGGRAILSSQTDVLDLDKDTQINLTMPPLFRFVGALIGPDKNPVADARVRATPSRAKTNLTLSELDLAAIAHCDEQGEFVFYLSSGPYDFEVLPGAGSLLFERSERNIEVGSNKTLEKRIVLEEGHRVRGQVVFPDRMLSQCLVRIEGGEQVGRQVYMARTDDEGQFAITVPGGTYKLIVTAHPKDAQSVLIDGQEHTNLAPWTKSIVVSKDTHVSVRLGEGTALKGRICDDAGQARPSLRVAVYPDTGHRPDADVLPLINGITDGEGRFSFFLTPGKYQIVVHRDYSSAKSVIVDNEPVFQDIVWHGWSQVTFEVTGQDGQKVPRCQVLYQPYGREVEDKEAPGAMPLPHGYLLTGDDGQCRLTLPAGIYTFRFEPPEAGSYVGRSIRQLSISSDIQRKVMLESKGR